MVTQEYSLNVIPGGINVRVHVNQYDNGSRTLRFNLYQGGAAYKPASGASVTCEGTIRDTTFSRGCTVSGNTADVVISGEMTAYAGSYPCSIKVVSGTTILASAEFTLVVAESQLAEKGVLTRYYYLGDVPGSANAPHTGYRKAVDAAIDAGVLAGRGGSGESLIVDLSEDACRLISIMYRAGVFESYVADPEVVYHAVSELPTWAQAPVQAMIDEGILSGTGTNPDGSVRIDLGADLLRSVVMTYRAMKAMGKLQWIGTQAEYEALEEHEDDTVYFVKEATT